MTLVEICVDDVAGAVTAEQCGADRIELCAGLMEDGVTPSLGTVGVTLRTVSRVGVQVMIRARGGDFVYDPAEVDVMLADIAAIRALPHASGVVPGFVIGALTADHGIDIETTGRLREACGQAPVTFHKAFDAVPDLAAALDTLIGMGIGRVLTSGGQPTAAEGAGALADLVTQGGDRISVLVGGGVRSGNVRDLLATTGATEVHLRAMETVNGRTFTSAARIRAVLEAVGRG